MGAFCKYPHKVACDCTEDNVFNINQLDGNDSCSETSSYDGNFSMPVEDIFNETDEVESDMSDVIDEEDLSTSAWYDDDNDDERSIETIVNIHMKSMPACDIWPPWYDHYQRSSEKRRPERKTLRRNNKLMKSNNLPIIAVSNLRSLMPKIKSFTDDIHERQIGCALLSEVWEKTTKKKQRFEIEKILHMKLKLIFHHPWGRGGGAV